MNTYLPPARSSSGAVVLRRAGSLASDDHQEVVRREERRHDNGLQSSDSRGDRQAGERGLQVAVVVSVLQQGVNIVEHGRRDVSRLDRNGHREGDLDGRSKPAPARNRRNRASADSHAAGRKAAELLDGIRDHGGHLLRNLGHRGVKVEGQRAVKLDSQRRRRGVVRGRRERRREGGRERQRSFSRANSGRTARHRRCSRARGRRSGG